ncbi:MAG: hypothetical protein HOE90_02660 [Bacteriovoracaceae bacterium]|jgi:hypothetical protein|nr:hypothetical protein [Bacteriovoracaceae bacterium]
MALPLQSSLNKAEISFGARSFVKKFQFLAGWNDLEMARILQVGESEFKQILADKKKFPIFAFQEMLNVLNVDFNSAILDSVDYKFLLDSFEGNVDSLPKYFAKGAFGKKRTVINILDYIEENYGLVYKTSLLREFQLKEHHFSDPEAAINNNFITDLLGSLYERGHDLNEVSKMGEQSYYSNKHGALGKILSQFSTPQEVFACIVEEIIDRFDRNFDYEIHKMNGELCEIRVRSNSDVADILEKKNLGNLPLSVSKVGVMSTFPMYAGFPKASVNLSKSIHLGDSYCSYHINF